MDIHLTYHNLLEAFGKPECALCFLADKFVEGHIRELFEDHVCDVKTRLHLRANLGFCAKHSRLVSEHGNSSSKATIYEDIIGNLSESLKKGKTDQLVKTASGKLVCLVCNDENDAVGRHIADFAENFAAPALSEAYKKSDGFCIRHLAMVVARIRNRHIVSEVLKTESAKIEGLHGELKELVRKFDYRYSHETVGKEGDSWLRAIRKVSGDW